MKKKIIMLVLIIAIIIAGTVMICVKDFNYSLLYSKTQRMNIYIEKEFNVDEIKGIAIEVLGNKRVVVETVDEFETAISILTTELTEEEQNNIITKLNEKYEIEIDKESDIVIVDIPQNSIWNVAEKYISPVITVTIAAIAFMAIRFRKQGIVKSLIIPIVSLILTMALYVSIVALVRIPVNELFVVLAILIYILTLICNTIKLSKTEN